MTRALRVAGYVALAAWVALALHYVFDGRAMFAPYGDTGADVAGVGSIAAFTTSPQNVLAMFGWQPWADFQQFYYLPMASDVVGVALALVVGNPFVAIKLAVVLILTVAFFGTAAAYAEAVEDSDWRWFAAAIYATVPMTVLQTRITAIGWVVALLPAALWANLWLAKRFGTRSAAAIGVICALATAAFDVEYAVFVGVPLLATSLAIARIKGVRVDVASVVIAATSFVLLPAYTVLFTVFGTHSMTWLRPNQAVPAQLTLFAQGVFDYVGGVLKESILSADPEFNATPSVPIALFAGALVWVLLAAGVACAARRTVWKPWWPVVTIALLCFLLSFGPTLPLLGSATWDAIGRIPVLQGLRTPDRFAQIVVLFVAFLAAYGASCMARRSRAGAILAAVMALGAIGGYLAFASREHVLALQPIDERVPDYAGVTADVETAGGRTVLFGFPLHGSQYDFAPYAPKSPGLSFAWDLAGHYGDNDAGVALLRRAAVRSIVTTPNWTRVSEAGIPADFAAVVRRSPFAAPPKIYPDGVGVFRIDARPMIAAVHPVCTYGGPAAFEAAAGLRAFDDDALIEGARAECKRTLFADYDPLDETLAAAAVARWTGSGAFGASDPLPIPNVFVISRFGIAAPWYRASYRGDSVLGGQPFLTYGYASATLPVTIARAGTYAVYVRTSGMASLQTAGARGEQVIGESRRVEGFGWVRLPLGRLAAGAHQIPLELLEAPESDMPAVVDWVVVAPAQEPIATQPDLVLTSLRAFEPPIAIRSYRQLFPRPYAGEVTPEGQQVVLAPGTRIGLYGGEMRVTVTGRMGLARFHWNGTSGDYVVAATGWLNEGAPTMTVSSGGQTLAIRYDPSIGIAQTTGYARMHLTQGAAVDVSLDGRPGGIAALTKIIAMPIQREETPTSYDRSGEIWEFGKNDPLQFYEAIHSGDVAIASGALRAFPGVTAEIPFSPVFSRGRVTANVQVTGGKGTAELRCGDRSDSSAVGSGSENPGGASLVVDRPQNGACSLRLTWNSETLTLESVVIHARGTILSNWTAQQYFSRGSYAWNAVDGARVVLSVDGMPWQWGRALALASGKHALTLQRAPLGMRPLLFARRGITPLPPLPSIAVSERSATSWSVTTIAATTLELAELDDGNWYASSGGERTPGYPCDLVNTCVNVRAGDAFVGRRVPWILALGLSITLLDMLVAAALLFLPKVGKPAGAAVAI
ncbi:MAG: hypothetical protein JOY98_14310 [Candidatus Eremiobacteraeota bacterium]|nr:hypothetical protein [Candidatus Eremiobacteraeota bacterium]